MWQRETFLQQTSFILSPPHLTSSAWSVSSFLLQFVLQLQLLSVTLSHTGHQPWKTVGAHNNSILMKPTFSNKLISFFQTKLVSIIFHQINIIEEIKSQNTIWASCNTAINLLTCLSYLLPPQPYINSRSFRCLQCLVKQRRSFPLFQVLSFSYLPKSL